MKLSASSNADTWRRFSDRLTASDRAISHRPRTLVLAAHPDDETIGASVPLSCMNSWVVFLTDGAPRDPSLRSSHHELSREAYGQLRLVECHQALAYACISADRVASFACVDQEAIYNIPTLVERLVSRIKELRPEIIVTHPYEGGHPDHDAAALVASIALAILQSEANPSRNVPLLVEMSSYHAVNQQLRTEEFLSCSSPLLEIQLTAQQRERKQTMLSTYTSQATVLQNFNTSREVFRPAPVYNFHAPPHHGKLWYECLGWDMTGEQWRSLAAEALAHFDQHVCR
jgi:LmbE family N-acetylglucosaminyl deacetylase